MLDKLKFKGPLIIASSLLFGFFFFIGSRLQADETMKGNRGIMRWLAEGLNSLVDAIGPSQAGLCIMGLSLFGGIYVAIWIWRDPNF